MIAHYGRSRTNHSSAFISVAEKRVFPFTWEWEWGLGREQGLAPAAMPLAGSFNEFISAGSGHCSCASVLLQLIISFYGSA